MDLGVFLASFGISLLELSEAGAVAVIYKGIYKSNMSYAYALAGVLAVLVPTFVLGRFLSYLPLDYVLVVAGVILLYFGYKLLRSARRSLKNVKRKHEKEERESLVVVFTVAATEAFEAALVVISLIPQSFSSALLGTALASLLVVALTYALKAKIMKIRVPQLKLVLSALLFSLGTLWLGEVALGIDEVYLPLLFLGYLGLNYALVKI
ncbi:MAG: hypothetical protein TQ35_0004630 [Candidatus Aramenus sulfurataquae]|jgi:uncharacterized membrane protein|uniref:Membrane protein n=2 Tax=Candidatus Aramenus sulfurataquae TaxID=1326980 RepID=A0A0F2LKM9_9CREN|nr:hypothetical protein [Candidatus Aramenus sulfurataquae]